MSTSGTHRSPPLPVVVPGRAFPEHVWATRSIPGQTGAVARGDNDAELSPIQPLEDRLAHHPVLVLFGQERQLFGEMGDPLLIGRLGVAVGHVGAPIASLWTIGLEKPLDVRREIAEWISFRRII